MSCYREVNGAYFARDTHAHDCPGVKCRGCVTCHERHCPARRTCAVHIDDGEHACPRCVGRVRSDLHQITTRYAEIPVEAEDAGVESEAANLAGPAVDPRAWTWRKVTAKQGGPWHVSLLEDDDEQHPYAVLTRWQMMLSEDYDHDLPDRLSIHGAAAYLARNLHRIAHDDEQDFPLLASELRACRSHLEAVLSDSRAPDRGIPCPECTDTGTAPPRLVRRYGHWCKYPDCTRIHYTDDSGDVWVCPRDPSHEWSHADYEARLVERRSA